MTQTKSYSIPGTHNITREVLPNGITVLVYENFAAQSVVINGSINSGSVYETAAQNGLASLTAEAVMRGTQNRSFDEINETLESSGADIGVSGGTFRTGFSGKGLAEDLPMLLDLAADVLRYPMFPTEQVERLKGEILTSLAYRQQDTRYRANRAFHEALYPDNHPYHYSSRGKPDTVRPLTADDLRTFHAKHYAPQGMIIVIAGAVKAEDAVNLVRERFADWSNPDQPAPPDVAQVAPPRQMRREVVKLPGKTQSDIVIGTLGPSRLDPHWLPASLANSVLGQFGMMGRVGNSVRETLGLAYYAYSSLDLGIAQPAWNVIAGVNPANVDLAIDRSIDEIRRLADELISEDDLSDNQAYFVGRLPLQLESNEGIAGSIKLMETYDLGLDYLVNYRDTIYSISREDVQRAVRAFLNPDALVIGVAGPDGR